MPMKYEQSGGCNHSWTPSTVRGGWICTECRATRTTPDFMPVECARWGHSYENIAILSDANPAATWRCRRCGLEPNEEESGMHVSRQHGTVPEPSERQKVIALIDQAIGVRNARRFIEVFLEYLDSSPYFDADGESHHGEFGDFLRWLCAGKREEG